MLLGLSGSFVRGLLVTSSGILAVFALLAPLVNALSFAPEALFGKMEIPVWGVGLGSMIFLFGRKKNTLWIVGGTIAGVAFTLL